MEKNPHHRPIDYPISPLILERWSPRAMTGEPLSEEEFLPLFEGLVVHGMAGFDYEAARKALNIPDSHAIHAMFAVGKRAQKNILSPELQQREAPSTQRKSIAEIAIEGPFPHNRTYS